MVTQLNHNQPQTRRSTASRRIKTVPPPIVRMMAHSSGPKGSPLLSSGPAMRYPANAPSPAATTAANTAVMNLTDVKRPSSCAAVRSMRNDTSKNKNMPAPNPKIGPRLLANHQAMSCTAAIRT